MIRLLAVDIDGTLTFKDRRLDTVGVEAVRRAEAAGIPVVIATGNILCFAEAAAVMIGVSGPLIAEDGGIVFDNVALKEYVLGDRVDADRGLAALQRAFKDVVQHRASFQRRTGITIRRNITVEEAQRVIQSEGLPIAAMDSGFAIHLKSPDVNKGNALRKVSSITKIPLTEIAAIGDGPNDIEMLETAGLSYAVANAAEEVKRACKRVTNSAHGKGVAEAVDEVIRLSGR